MEIAILASGDAKIELICDGADRETNAGNDISWGFKVESLDKSLALQITGTKSQGRFF